MIKVAICDDDILLCANLRRKLAAFDTGGNKLFVDEYHSGEELLKGACRCNYDAVFLDLYMEGMSGFDTAKALAERKSEARIIFLTLYRRTQQKLDKITEATREDLTGVRVIRAFGREETQITNFAERNSKLLHAQIHVGDMSAIMNPLTYVTINAVIIAVLWFGSDMVEGGVLFSGDIIALINYINQILVELVKLANLIVIISKSLASMGRVGQVLDMESSMTFEGNAKGTETAEAVRFDHVDMRYAGAGADSLTDITFTAKKGQTIGIIGGTGSAKTSLVNLISRLYDVTKGEVLVGGRNVKDYDMEVLRDQVSVVLQNNVLFSGTILDNLRWGDKEATLEECRHACELACADEFIDRFPKGYDTYIEQGGSNVSGGQKQRLCIARALLKKPKVLILDDSTSAVDTATDAKIRRAFREEIPDTTKLIIAQRISSVQDADRIIVMEDGKVNGFGTHEELLEQNDIYREVYESQTSGGGDFDEKEGE